MRVQLASVKWQNDAGEQMGVEPCKQVGQPAFIRRGDDQHAGALRGREHAIVQVVAVEGDERSP
ncbi:hypothetical protein D3C83_242260 [compost metagenome]